MSRSVIAAAVVSLVVLTGCGGTNEPSAPPTSEAALTTATTEPDVEVETTEAAPTTEAPEETEDPASDEMDQTEAGAEAFVEHYFDTLNGARSSGDTVALQSLSTSGCQSCTNFEETAEPGSLPALAFDIEDAVISGDTAIIPVNVTQEDTTGKVYFELQWSGNWLVATVKAEP